MHIRLLCSLILVLTVGHTRGCQEPWRLESSSVSEGSVIGFSNRTTIGVEESLTWSWADEGIWVINIIRSLQEDKIEGEIARHGVKAVVKIPWAIKGNKIDSLSNRKRIFSEPWRLSICNGFSIKFTSDKTGSWILKIGNFILQKKPEEMDRYLSRRKRGEDFVMNYNADSFMNSTEEPRGILDTVYEYFFAEGDEAAGRSAGIFTRVKNWMRDVTCRLGSGVGVGCEGYFSQPTYPTVTMPPSDPDAESFTQVTNKENEVF